MAGSEFENAVNTKSADVEKTMVSSENGDRTSDASRLEKGGKPKGRIRRLLDVAVSLMAVLTLVSFCSSTCAGPKDEIEGKWMGVGVASDVSLEEARAGDIGSSAILPMDRDEDYIKFDSSGHGEVGTAGESVSFSWETSEEQGDAQSQLLTYRLRFETGKTAYAFIDLEDSGTLDVVFPSDDDAVSVWLFKR
ncbi:hypothetical protein VJ923_09580 [Adlercreutzia sp. R25]|uniref:Lipocalin-like domain-containing protein n=1 Tax=Adlercreutzia shanghongiae TaxID=3111773 RepID=A0ABU6J0A0_9ACTN|nr:MULTISPECIES: hypothetical protein [unclassified Adlercreutzia]MEC4273405.1 hypothetical protein [Adlercreutzia sp. R25]MEC4295557.1 hypothetical protein [Adlercreutzia sp. R22]